MGSYQAAVLLRRALGICSLKPESIVKRAFYSLRDMVATAALDDWTINACKTTNVSLLMAHFESQAVGFFQRLAA